MSLIKNVIFKLLHYFDLYDLSHATKRQKYLYPWKCIVFSKQLQEMDVKIYANFYQPFYDQRWPLKKK